MFLTKMLKIIITLLWLDFNNNLLVQYGYVNDNQVHSNITFPIVHKQIYFHAAQGADTYVYVTHCSFEHVSLSQAKLKGGAPNQQGITHSDLGNFPKMWLTIGI